MRVVFMGTPDIAETCLRKLVADGFEIVGVYTKPDMPKNRGMKLSMSPVKAYATAQNIPVFQPTTFREEGAVSALAALQPDVLAVVAYGKILPQRVLDIPRLGCVNIHTSILPLLRGPAPTQWAILRGYTETGVTAQHMAAEMDAGDIIEIRKTAIAPQENAQELLGRLAGIGSQLLSDTLRRFEAGTVDRSPQKHENASYAPMLTKELSPIDWSKSAQEIMNHVRGLHPWPIASTQLDGKRFRIYSVCKTNKKTDAPAGTPLSICKQGLEIACGVGEVLLITQLQADGGKRMAAADYFRGHPLKL
ncbi:MAG: methionyl-tRNA formyltransferase [Oscillospiraceae bacterium]|jgi:methionyl-tRNA formyltransferase|nr:methionyl-tRNA formyltransferase [Oscillospiraceae bacterium]